MRTIVDLLLSDGTRVQVALLFLADQHNAGPLYYLQSVRSVADPGILASAKAQYEQVERFCAERLALQLQHPVDAVLCPPSKHPFAKRFADAVNYRFPGATNISSRFHRKDGVRAGEATVSSHDLTAAISYAREGDEQTWKSLVIVDDIFGAGKTSGSLIYHLRQAGLRAETHITVACPLIIKQ